MGATTNQGTGLGAVPTPTTQYLQKEIWELTGNAGGGLSGGSGSVARLGQVNDGMQLTTQPSVYFLSLDINSPQGYTIYLPDPSTMAGRELLFLNVSNFSEYGINIIGSIESQGQNSYFLGANSLFRMVSDGSIWWTTQESYA